MTGSTIDYSHYFWQGEKTRLRPFRLEDAELRFIASLDSPTRQAHIGGIEFPTSVELQKAWLEKVAGCQDNGGLILFATENLAGATIGWVSLHSCDQKNGTFSNSFFNGEYHDDVMFGMTREEFDELMKT